MGSPVRWSRGTPATAPVRTSSSRTPAVTTFSLSSTLLFTGGPDYRLGLASAAGCKHTAGTRWSVRDSFSIFFWRATVDARDPPDRQRDPRRVGLRRRDDRRLD